MFILFIVHNMNAYKVTKINNVFINSKLIKCVIESFRNNLFPTVIPQKDNDFKM